MTEFSLPTTDNISTLNITNNLSTAKIAIIGGGLTGLLTAILLERAIGQQAVQQNDEPNANTAVDNQQPQITVFEKSRSVGRLATRYRTDKKTNNNWQWAFGAQFFTAKSDSFSQFIQPWLDSGLLQPWCAQVVELTPVSDSVQAPIINKKEQWDNTHARFVSTPKMTSWGRELADELSSTTVKFKTRVAPLSHSQNKDQQTELFDETGESLGLFDWVICTAPNGQAVDLMADSSFTEQAQILKPKMQGCYTLMLGWDSLDTLPESLNKDFSEAWDVAYPQDSILGKIFVEHHKPNHDDILPSVTIHARNDWSDAHIDEDIESIQAQLLIAAQQALNWYEETAPSQVDCHRWRYAATVVNKNGYANENKELGILVDNEHNWIVSGDWCGQGNIESCYRMAMETVEAITGAIDK